MAESVSWRNCAFVKLMGVSTPLTLGAIACAGLLHVQPVEALEFGSGEFQGSLDITLSHGITYRFEKQDPGLVSDINGNDGNLNYNRGLASNTSKFTADLDVGTNSFGVFVRATGFLDFENRNGDRERTHLPHEAKNAAVQNIELLDAYVTSAFDIGDAAVDIRLGKHVLNWGESTFIPNGINAINPFDVSKLRLPGSELREALLPVSMVSASVAPNQYLSFEGFYQLDWEQTRIDPVGTLFSSTDYVGAGARKAVLSDIAAPLGIGDRGGGFGPLTPAINADLASAGLPAQAAYDPDFLAVLRGTDGTPSNSGQWGIALRYFAEELGQTEFGFYYINYHSRLPLVSATTSSRAALGGAVAAAGAISASGSQTTSAVCQNPLNPIADPTACATAVGGIAAALAIDRYTDRQFRSGNYFLEYPKDIKLAGVSFNTVLGASGWALQGEYSFRDDAPLQRAERTVLGEGLAPVLTALSPLIADKQAFVAAYEPNEIRGYVRNDVSQIQATGTKVLGPMLGADSSVLLLEAAIMHVHGMPDEPIESPAGGVLATEEADADATSWGYRVAARLDYNNAVGPINLFPYAQFLHDVNGNSPAPSGPFVEGRTAITLGLGADYLSSWQGDISYTNYAGNGNELSDRDFISASIKYSF